MAEAKYIHNLRYDPTTLKPGETVLERWPELAVHPILLDNGFGPEKDPFLRYCILLSEGSGLHAAIGEWPDRKKEALRLAGVKPDHPRYQLVLDMKDDAVQDMRWAWLKAFSSRKFRAYVAGCEAFDQNCRKVETQIDDNMGGLPEINISLQIDGRTNQKEAEALAEMAVDRIATELGANKSDMKEDAIQRAYKLRNELFKELPNQDKQLADMEAQLFMGDDELKRLATERAKPHAEAGSIEAKIMGRKQK